MLSNLAAVATIVAVSVSAYKYFREKNREKSRAARNLYFELNNALEALDSKRFPGSYCEIDVTPQSATKKTTIRVMARTFNHDFYDSLISSGMINFLEPELQQPIQDIFKWLKTHNRFLVTALEMSEQDGEKVPQRSHRYYERASADEERLNAEIPKMMERLRKHT